MNIHQQLSTKSIRELLYPGAETYIIGHTEPWMNAVGHHTKDKVTRFPGYNSNDPVAIAAQTAKLKRMGLNALMYNNYAPGGYEDQCTQVYFAVSPLDHIINIDGATWTDQASLEKMIAYTRSTYFPDQHYHKTAAGKYMLTFFLKDQNDESCLDTVIAKNPDIEFVFNDNNSAHSQMGWVQSDLIANLDWWIRTYGLRGGVNIPALFTGFDDTYMGHSVWNPNQPPRVWPPKIGPNATTLQQCFDKYNQYYSEKVPLVYLQAVTVNDWDEGTGIEFAFPDAGAPIPKP